MKKVFCRAVQPSQAQVFIQHNDRRRQTAEQMFGKLMILSWALFYLIHHFLVIEGLVVPIHGWLHKTEQKSGPLPRDICKYTLTLRLLFFGLSRAHDDACTALLRILAHQISASINKSRPLCWALCTAVIAGAKKRASTESTPFCSETLLKTELLLWSSRSLQPPCKGLHLTPYVDLPSDQPNHRRVWLLGYGWMRRDLRYRS